MAKTKKQPKRRAIIVHQMKFLIRTLFSLVLGVLMLEQASAFNYSNRDVILSFRKAGSDDLVYNLGPVSQFSEVADGSTITVSGFDLSILRAAYGDVLENVTVAIFAGTSPGGAAANVRAWLSAGDPSSVPTDRSGSQISKILSKVNGVGQGAAFETRTNSTPNYQSPPDKHNSYSDILSSAGTALGLIPTLGGQSDFVIEATLPAELRFFELKIDNTIPKPAAKQLGVFQMGLEGVLKYTSGTGVVLPPLESVTITSVTHDSGTVTLSFESRTGVKYRVRSAESLGTRPSSWSIGSLIDGTGAPVQLTDSPATATRFYVVESYR